MGLETKTITLSIKRKMNPSNLCTKPRFSVHYKYNGESEELCPNLNLNEVAEAIRIRFGSDVAVVGDNCSPIFVNLVRNYLTQSQYASVGGSR